MVLLTPLIINISKWGTSASLSKKFLNKQKSLDLSCEIHYIPLTIKPRGGEELNPKSWIKIQMLWINHTPDVFH